VVARRLDRVAARAANAVGHRDVLSGTCGRVGWGQGTEVSQRRRAGDWRVSVMHRGREGHTKT
jgi:hypothetical protein